MLVWGAFVHARSDNPEFLQHRDPVRGEHRAAGALVGQPYAELHRAFLPLVHSVFDVTPADARQGALTGQVRAGRCHPPLPRGCPAAAGPRRGGGRFRRRDAERAQPLPLRLDTGVALATELGQFSAGGRALYDPRPGDPGRWDWTGDTP